MCTSRGPRARKHSDYKIESECRSTHRAYPFLNNRFFFLFSFQHGGFADFFKISPTLFSAHIKNTFFF